MHIDTLYESQAIKLLHDICNSLGIEQQDRTRETLRDKLSVIKLGAFVHAVTQEISPPHTSCEAFTVHGGDKLKISVRLASEAEQSGVLSAAYGKTGPGWVDERLCDKCESSMEYYDGYHCPKCDSDVRSCAWDK